MNKEILLTDRLVGDIEGQFLIPSYQRGYRWSKSEVRALLDDILSLDDNKQYCLQPIVVCSHSNGTYEVVDGQQRLTTLLIIYRYMGTLFSQIQPGFSISYETRNGNEEFFNNITDASLADQNIDFWFIHNAYCVVKEWFESKGKADFVFLIPKIFGRLRQQVKVIWYELHSSNRDEAIALFTRLNIGRIPLTNAELVKALFLSRDKGLTRQQQLEIATQWDTIEHELQDEDFWYFLTRTKPGNYQTKIELIFDFMAGKKPGDREKYSTFHHFNSSATSPVEQWNAIKYYYYRLKEWYLSNEAKSSAKMPRHLLYHKIGYLVASGWTTIDGLMKETAGLRKSAINTLLDDKIRESVACDSYADLTYDNNYALISRILLLFNVMSVVQSGSGARFPFREYHNESWSLEHIHARQSQGLNTQEKWRQWLGEHLTSLLTLEENPDIKTLKDDINNALQSETLTETVFTPLSERVTQALSDNDGQESIDSLSNMALLPVGVNSALRNYLFDVKRRKILEMDAQGRFIPYCTRMVFMKYYTSEQADNVTYHYWGRTDREIYINKMNSVLKQYLKGEIVND